MREIKFKAWDKTNNEWFMNGDVFDLKFSGSHGDFFFDNDHPLNMRDVDLEWLEFTGVKDNNGVDIYEGDVIYLAGYGDYTAEFPFIDLYEGAAESDVGSIIGNIYQNGERYV